MKIETPVLKRLGPVPFWRGESRCLDLLETIYRRAISAAESALGGETAHDAPDQHPTSPRNRRSALTRPDHSGQPDFA